jgi:sporulation protein YlmC with PRC-barrel domain
MFLLDRNRAWKEAAPQKEIASHVYLAITFCKGDVMAHLGTLRDYEFSSEAEDIRGSDLYGQDNEKLGTIDDVIFDHSSGEIRYAVVAAGGWLNNRKFLVPANQISHSRESDDFYAPVSKQQVERFPAYDEKLIERNEDWAEYERKYHSAWEEGPVLHMKDSNRIITPPSDQMPVGSSGGESATTERRPNLQKEGGVVGRYEPPSAMPPLATERHDIGTAELRSPAGTPATQASAKTTAALHQRWEAFEQTLRNNREEILARCGVCYPKSDRKREVA